MGGGVSVNFASFLAGGSKQVLRVTMTLALDAPVARGSLVFHLLNIAGVTPACCCFLPQLAGTRHGKAWLQTTQIILRSAERTVG